MSSTLFRRRAFAAASLATASVFVLAACSSGGGEATPEPTDNGDTTASESYTIGINQLVQHPALDAAAEGFIAAFEDAGIDVEWDAQNANGEQSTALTIAQTFSSNSDLDMVLAIATPAAQSTIQAVADRPVLFTAVTDPVAADIVDSMDAPGGNSTGTSDMAPIEDQFKLIQELVPDVATVGIVYSSGEVNSEVQVEEAQVAAEGLGIELKTQTVTSVNDIQQAVDALGSVDAIWVPTDNMVVSGIASLIQVAEQNQIPVIGSEAGTVEGGAIATLGIDYFQLGYQTGEMAIEILEGADPASMAVQTANDFTYVVNPGAAERMGVEIPQSILDQAETVE